MMVATQYPVYRILGTHNVRDLGGYRTKGGKITKTERFIRSDSLHRIGAEGINFLVRKNLSTVIDLRTSNEIEKEPNPFSDIGGVKYLNIPLLENLAPAFLGTSKIREISNDPLLSFYLSALHERQSAIRNIFSAMSEADQGLILINCTAGKDRTGIISALLLGLVDVPSVDIIKNYTDSELFISGLVEEFLERSRQRGGDVESYAQMLKCPGETMANALNSICISDQDIHTYLMKIGLSREQLLKVSHRLVESAY